MSRSETVSPGSDLPASNFPVSAVELRDALRAGEVSAREAAEHFLARIVERADLGAFVAVTAEQALAEADAADARFAALSEDERAGLPPLHGLPIAHKDLVDVTGVPTTLGSAALPHPVAERDHPGVAVLRAAGAISLGKTQVPELGLNAYSENLIAPPARNPLDPERTAGGSSGGSAAAVAAGLLPVAPGSDGGGSIRIPSLACGLIGLKPGLGAVPTDLEHGPVDDFGAPRLPVSGPIARTAEDAALLFDAMAGTPGSALGAVRDADALQGSGSAAPRRSRSPTRCRSRPRPGSPGRPRPSGSRRRGTGSRRRGCATTPDTPRPSAPAGWRVSRCWSWQRGTRIG